MEAREVIAAHPDAAMILLDVVMETDQAGLEVARYTRDEIDNQSVRIVLRTGQPGQAPERDVITKYDINDYKEKTELTVQKLYTVLYASLRAYRDIVALEKNKSGLEKVIIASKNLFQPDSMKNLTEAILEQLTSVLHLESSAACMLADCMAACHDGKRLCITAGTGAYADTVGMDVKDVLDEEALSEVLNALEKKENQYTDRTFTGYFKSPDGPENLYFMRSFQSFSVLDHNLMKIFSKNISIGIENMELFQDIKLTQQEIVYLLGDAVETRSNETGNHVKRVAEISKLIGLDIGLDEAEAEILKHAAPMHDVGKIGIPDSILNKPGKHSKGEFEIMKKHALLGFDMLKSSQRKF